ncbi:5-hydroxytryptamine receptor 3A-like [Microcaecilia unicolor]|uniref:5-hydroxytryptamine receptor 3A-like n=1 Tax=Microcaecilia unicolor TaxID=1415580 RepID=A0A6P7Y5B3_9AMPH|nr:5-hydroxytryptamine receptor 3A-like [Microcaecilia unicolor]
MASDRRGPTPAHPVAPGNLDPSSGGPKPASLVREPALRDTTQMMDTAGTSGGTHRPDNVNVDMIVGERESFSEQSNSRAEQGAHTERGGTNTCQSTLTSEAKPTKNKKGKKKKKGKGKKKSRRRDSNTESSTDSSSSSSSSSDEDDEEQNAELAAAGSRDERPPPLAALPCIWRLVPKSTRKTHWKNEFLSWNPEDFCNITYITLPVNLFWVPDIFFGEQVGEDKAPQMPYIELMYDGTMTTGSPHQIISTCNLDVNKFPFDTQSCDLSISLWLHSVKEVVLRNTKSTAQATRESKELYLSTGEWNFKEIKITRLKVAVPLEENKEYSFIVYEISMTRIPVLHVLNLLLPTTCFLILDITISSIPEHYGDKISFKITLILGVSVLSLLLNEILPSTSNNPPIIALFFTGSFMFMITGLLETFFLLYLKDKPQHPLLRLINQMLKYFKRDKKKTKMSHDSDLGSEFHNTGTT